jgi:hypothetical protein
MRVSYEELTTQPEQTMRSLCEWLDIPFEPGMLHYWRHDHHLVDGNLGTRLLVFKYREQFGSDLMQRWSQENRETGQTDDEFYNQLGLAIKLDLRWKRELTPEQLEVFEAVAGKVNRPYAYDGDGAKGSPASVSPDLRQLETSLAPPATDGDGG